jgi:hypothetical protein
MNALSILGIPTMESLIWQLNQKGVSFAASTFDIAQFNKELEVLFGEGSGVIIQLIYQKLCARMGVTIDETGGTLTIEKIRQIVELST